MKIGVYGGTFNPIHNGHIYLLKYLLESKICDKIIVLVAGKPPHKNDGIIEEKHRLNMVKLALSDTINIIVSDIEIGRKEKSYTYNTMHILKDIYKNDDLWFIVGADSFKDLPKWYNGEKLIKENKFIAVNREGAFENKEYLEKFSEVKEIYGAIVETVGVKTPDISSSFLRETIKTGGDISSYVPQKVFEYIKNNNLYMG